MTARGERGSGQIACMDRAIVDDSDDGIDRRAGLCAEEAVERLQMSDEIALFLVHEVVRMISLRA